MDKIPDSSLSTRYAKLVQRMMQRYYDETSKDAVQLRDFIQAWLILIIILGIISSIAFYVARQVTNETLFMFFGTMWGISTFAMIWVIVTGIQKISQPLEYYSSLDFKYDLIVNEFVAEEEIEGCTLEEVEMVRQANKARYLPEVYIDLLLVVGKVSKPIENFYLQGLFYPDVLETFRIVSERLIIPQNVVIIAYMCHEESTEAYYFKLDGSQDPDIYYMAGSKVWGDEEDEEMQYRSIRFFLQREVQDLITHAEALR